ncbi:MAG TPA: cytochrome c nitrite reductase small subunit [Bacteroidales bacterium]|nr:MAG: Cytochrome c-type protein NrfH [Bacteroidetes bacterium ADurb.Bin217]HOS84401.1 cytochrome c nitrite reductase small subunit [Bacteroidales bacterium]HPH16533.1 cytochrome c nitrite reductase small subunit [Bacteroidales bacterium]HPM12887.1 cytochrome c nitrite reductase small subunit [Bacteroidales bacterium]
MKRILQFVSFLFPPAQWRIPVIIVSGICIGLFAFMFYISNAHSYLSDDPKTCVNCHIMAPQYATWMHSSHRERATCNDCHVPHDNVFNTYYFKAKDGLRHATVFTMRGEPQVIKIKEEGHHVVHQNCIRCHTDLLTDAKMNTIHAQFYNERTERTCWECHSEVPHGKVKSLTSTPYARVPLPESPVPNWLSNLMSK